MPGIYFPGIYFPLNARTGLLRRVETPVCRAFSSMTYSEFHATIQAQPDSIVLLEGRRSIPPDGIRQATALAQRLASEFPQLRFRSGNAAGTDETFSVSVAQVDPSRLQVVVPYPSHRKSARVLGASYTSLEELQPEEDALIVAKTLAATPAHKGLIAMRGKKGALGAKAAYLLRDTMKVMGYSENFPRPVAAFFWIDPAEPHAGGTGHTIRVCRQEGVPCVFQDEWGSWYNSPPPVFAHTTPKACQPNGQNG
jgi:hypothetical protein